MLAKSELLDTLFKQWILTAFLVLLWAETQKQVLISYLRHTETSLAFSQALTTLTNASINLKTLNLYVLTIKEE